jgi:hypothetical protein
MLVPAAVVALGCAFLIFLGCVPLGIAGLVLCGAILLFWRTGF